MRDDVWGYPLVVMFDGGARPNPGKGYGSYRLKILSWGPIHRVDFDWLGDLTNNEAEYLILIEALHRVSRIYAPDSTTRARTRLEFVGDSRLVLSQIDGTFAVGAPRMGYLRDAVRSLTAGYRQIVTRPIPREEIAAIFGH